MKRGELPIPEPCRESLADMRVLPTKQRYCEKCEHSVIDVSAMTESQARRFLARAQPSGVCVSYLVGADGQIAFQPTQPRRSLAAPALLGLSLAATACHGKKQQVVGFTDMWRPPAGTMIAPDAGASPVSSAAPVSSATATVPVSSSAPVTPPVTSAHAVPTVAARGPKLTRLAGKPSIGAAEHVACDTPPSASSAKPPAF